MNLFFILCHNLFLPLFFRLRLFIPAFIESDIYRNIPDNITFFDCDIFNVRYVGKKRFFLFQFHGDPVSCCFVGVFNCIIQCLSVCFAVFQVWEKRMIAFF